MHMIICTMDIYASYVIHYHYVIISFIVIARSRYKHPALARDLVPRAVVNILAREIDLLPDGTVGRNVSFSYFPYVCPKPVLVNIRIFSINSRQKGENRFRTHHRGRFQFVSTYPMPSYKKHHSLCEFSLCLSRACLGKLIVFKKHLCRLV
jgi:hypothetical protein